MSHLIFFQTKKYLYINNIFWFRLLTGETLLLLDDTSVGFTVGQKKQREDVS